MKTMVLVFLLASTVHLASAGAKPLYKCATEDGLVELVVIATGKTSVGFANTLKFEGYIPETISLECRTHKQVSEADDIAVICRGHKAMTVFEIQIHDNGYTWLPTAEGAVTVGGFSGGVHINNLGRMTCPR